MQLVSAHFAYIGEEHHPHGLACEIFAETRIEPRRFFMAATPLH